MKEEEKRLSLPIKILIALVLGVLVGIVMTDHSKIAITYIKPLEMHF